MVTEQEKRRGINPAFSLAWELLAQQPKPFFHRLDEV